MPNQEDQLTFEPRICTAELLCAEPVALAKDTRDAIVADLSAALGGVTVLREDATTMHLALEGYPVEYEGGEKVPAQVLLVSAASPEMNPDPEKTAAALETSLSQTWDWDEAGEAVQNAPHTFLVSDFLASGLEAEQRITIFTATMVAAVRHIPCEALHFPASQSLVKPEAYLEGALGGEDEYPLLGLVNVRFFTVEDTEDEIVMDTLGLNVFGLPDAQCHCAGVEPGELAGWLYSLSVYIAGTEKEINDGDTVDGFGDMTLAMHYGESLVSPRRVVLDLQPAEPILEKESRE